MNKSVLFLTTYVYTLFNKCQVLPCIIYDVLLALVATVGYLKYMCVFIILSALHIICICIKPVLHSQFNSPKLNTRIAQYCSTNNDIDIAALNWTQIFQGMPKKKHANFQICKFSFPYIKV